MRYLLSRASRPVLARLAQERTLCAFDFDGTLAPIAAHPGEAVLCDRTRNLLARLAALYPCLILSGRSRADLMDKLQGSGIERFIGSHGAETEDSVRNRHPQLRRWKAAIESELSGSPGVWIEDKGLSLAVHYRQAPRKAEAKRRILRATQNLEQACVFGGKQVVNLTVDGDPHKGIALAAERGRLACNWVLYVGDDENDEEAFAIGGNLVGVRVGKRSRTHARYYLRSQGEIDSLLETVIALRESMPAPA